MSAAVLAKLRLAAIQAYLETGRYHTAGELAALVGVSRSTAHRAIADEGHGQLGRDMTSIRDERLTYSKDYPTMESGAVRVWTYGPRTFLLREALVVSAVCAGLRALNPPAAFQGEPCSWCGSTVGYDTTSNSWDGNLRCADCGGS